MSSIKQVTVRAFNPRTQSGRFRSLTAALLIAPMIPYMVAVSAAAPQRRPAPPSGTFAGFWVNSDQNSPNVTKAVIRDVSGQVLVHMWGKCQPVDCDWGESRLDGRGSVRHVTWRFDFKIATQTLTLDGDRLLIATHSHFTDNSGRADYDVTDLMTKPQRID